MIIYHHLGLGDHLICYGLVRELMPEAVLCKSINYPTVSYMYSGTGIDVIPVNDDSEAEKYNALKIGFNDATMADEIFGTEFYRQAGVPYNVRWKYEIGGEVEQCTGEGNFIHLLDNTDMEGIRPAYNKFPNIFSYKDVIENAPEVHVSESSFRQLIDFLNPKGKLFLHFNKEKSWRVVPSKHQWIIK